MTHSVIEIDPDDKAWLEREARRLNIPVGELLQHAIRKLRVGSESESLSGLLERTRGIWKGGDGLQYQRKIRDEWTREE